MSDPLLGNIIGIVFLALAGLAYLFKAVLKDLDKPRLEVSITAVAFALMGFFMLFTS